MGNALVVFGAGRSDLALYGEDAQFFFNEGLDLLKKFRDNEELSYLAEWLTEARAVPPPQGSWLLIPSMCSGTRVVINEPYSGAGLLKTTRIADELAYTVADARFRPLSRLLLASIAHQLSVGILPQPEASGYVVESEVSHIPVQPVIEYGRLSGATLPT